MMGETGRELMVVVEMDFDTCTRVYGSAPCAAVLGTTGVRKCFNTFKTFQDTANFAKGVQTLRFARNISGLPKGQTIFPALANNPITNAAEINLSGIDPRTNALGKRARVEVRLKDFAYHDTYTDPYQGDRVSGAAQASGIGYDPSQGTFFGKLSNRNPYYHGRPLRILTGRVGQDLGTFDARHYVMSEWSGPDAQGNVNVTAKDVLDLADNAKAVAPAASRGKLSLDIDAAATSITLSPATVGDEYAASGLICVGREIMSFTRSGDVLTVVRGLEGTAAVPHSVNDVAQQCLVYLPDRPSTVVADLLTTYAGISSGFIDTTAWQAENDNWLAGLRIGTVITKPTGVATLVGEICQHGFMVWWDEVAQEIRFRANRPISIGEVALPLTDPAHNISGSIDIDRNDDKRISQMQFWHGVLDYTDFADNGDKFKALASFINAAAENVNAYGESRIKNIYSRWFGRAGNDAAATVIAERLAGRYEETPLTFSATLDAKDKSLITLATVVSVTSQVLQDDIGAQIPTQMQINYVEERNDRIAIRAESYTIQGRFGFWLDDPTADYDAPADAEDIAFGAYWMDDTVGVFPDATGPYVYF
jgi:hypothetical protein